VPARRVAVRAAAAATAALAVATLGAARAPAEPGTAVPGRATVSVAAASTAGDVDVTLPLGVGISGRVLSTRGRPVDEAAVSVFSAGGNRLGRAASAADGRFRFGPLPAARGYYVCVNHHGAGFHARTATGHLGRCVGSAADYDGTAPTQGATLFSGRSGTIVHGLRIRLPLGAAVSGRLVDARSGNPLGGTTIEVFDRAGRLVRAGAVDGDYQVLGLTSGDYRICVRANDTAAHLGRDEVVGAGGPGYARRCTRMVRLVAGRHRSGVDLPLPVAAAVRGTVRGEGELAVRDSRVRVFRAGTLIATARTDRSGGFEVAGLRRGRYRVCAHGGQAGRSPVRYDLPRCVPVTLAAGRTRSGLTVRPEHSVQQFGALAGTVRSDDGTALGGIAVDVYDSDGRYRDSTSTGRDGRYRLGGLPIGSYVVCANRTAGGTADRYGAACADDAAWNQADLPGDAAPVFVTAGGTTAGTDVTLPAAATVTGRITAAGVPLPGQTVWLLSAAGNVIDWRWTNATGRYTFGGLGAVPRGYGVCVSAPQADDTVATRIAPATGLRSQCYRDVRWRRPLAAVPH
jgi:hypothetical protein